MRLAGGSDSAIVVTEDGAQTALASSSQDRGWRSILDRALSQGTAHVQTIAVLGDSVVALTPVPAPHGQGIYAVAKAADPGFSPDDLDRLAEVAELVALALATGPPEPAPAAPSASVRRESPTQQPVGDFHHKLPAAFQRLEGLPALNESRNVLLEVLARPDATPDAIVAAIESDIALLIAVLRLANQAAGGKRPSVWSVPEAVEVLTPEGVEALARRITVFDFFQKIRGWTVPPERFRLHAVLTQRAAQRLARTVGHPDTDRIVVAALLHDVGKLVLMEAYPGYPEKVLGDADTPEERIVAERRQLGIDHEMVGGVLLRRWQLPERLAEVVARHHTGQHDSDAALLRLADALAHYAQGRPVAPNQLLVAAKAIGVSPEQLRAVMYELLQGEGRGRFRSVEASPLTERQTEMLRELAKGSSYKEIGAALGVSVSTVRTHFHHIYRTMGVNNRAQAVLTATERGWL
jgi:putative nucleotidyltransferase with HDIG domain